MSAAHDSIEKQLGCSACLERYAIRHELKNHYYSNHSETLIATQHQRQCQTTNSVDSAVEQQEIVISNDVAPITEQLEQSGKQNKRRASSNDFIESELLNPACIFFSPPNPQNHFMVQSLDMNIAFFNFQRSIFNNKWKLTLEIT